MIDLSIEMESLTKSLVRIKSVNGTTGERDIAEFILRWLQALPYFAAHPEQAFAQPITGDALGRENVFAYVRGTKAGGDASRAILWHGHIDTVGTEDFGALEPYATEPDELLERLLAGGLPEAVRTDLATGDGCPGAARAT